jgi:hypothetical protein
MTFPLADKKEQSLAFLRLVLPEDGTFFVFSKRLSHIALSSHEEIVDRITELQTDAWFAAASFRDNTSRKAANVFRLRSLRLDVDYGPGKPCGTAQEALQEIARFARSSGFPEPVLVSTGHGYHAWYPLGEDLALNDWLPLARGLSSQAAKLGIKIAKADAAVISDAARLMRLPGSINYKNPSDPKPVFLHRPEQLERPPVSKSLFERYAVHKTPDAPPPSDPELLAKIKDALSVLPLEAADDRDVWFRIGAAIHDVDRSEHGYDVWAAWSKQSNKYNEKDQRYTWNSYGRGYDGERVTVNTIFGLAQQHGWPHALSDEPSFVHWELAKEGTKKPSLKNAQTAINLLKVKCVRNIFSGQLEITYPYDRWHGKGIVLFDDCILNHMRGLILERFKLELKIDTIVGAVYIEAEKNAYDPLLIYLDNLHWDGTPRIDDWVINYLGVDDTPLNREIGRLLLISLIARAYKPGIKLDYMWVLIGKQGTGKSTAAKILGRGFFSDAHINLKDPRQAVEVLSGVWVHELAEIASLNTLRSVDHLKAFISTTVDTARAAYAREVAHRKRRCVFIGTSNVTGPFLSDITGNRRFLILETNKIKLSELEKDVDQLYAEAKTVLDVETIYKRDINLSLPKQYAKEARRMQTSYTAPPPYADILEGLKGKKENIGGVLYETISVKDVYIFLEMSNKDLTRSVQMDVANTMRFLGWKNTSRRYGDSIVKIWRREINAQEEKELFYGFDEAD